MRTIILTACLVFIFGVSCSYADDYAEIHKEMAKLHKAVESYDNSVNTFTLELGKFSKQTDEYNNQIDDFRKQIDGFNKQIKEYKDQINYFNTEITGFTKQANELGALANKLKIFSYIGFSFVFFIELLIIYGAFTYLQYQKGKANWLSTWFMKRFM